MKKFIYALLILISACTTSSITNITESDDGKTFYTAVGEEISITLTGNATTGYKWQFSTDKPAHTTVIKDTYVADKHPTGMVGVGGKSIYQVKVMKSGRFVITAQYYRPWENFDPSKDKHFIFIFEAK